MPAICHLPAVTRQLLSPATCHPPPVTRLLSPAGTLNTVLPTIRLMQQRQPAGINSMQRGHIAVVSSVSALPKDSVLFAGGLGLHVGLYVSLGWATSHVCQRFCSAGRGLIRGSGQFCALKTPPIAPPPHTHKILHSRACI